MEVSGGVLNSRRRSDLKEDASDLRRQEVVAKAQESERERDGHKASYIHRSWSNQPWTTIQAWYLYPQARAEAFSAYYKCSPSTYG
jgi:hypothetical protein